MMTENNFCSFKRTTFQIIKKKNQNKNAQITYLCKENGKIEFKIFGIQKKTEIRTFAINQQ